MILIFLKQKVEIFLVQRPSEFITICYLGSAFVDFKRLGSNFCLFLIISCWRK